MNDRDRKPRFSRGPGKGPDKAHEKPRDGGPHKGRDKGGRPDRNDRNSGGATRPYASSAPPQERNRPIDPNSPFAKLAALKEQLTGRKD